MANSRPTKLVKRSSFPGQEERTEEKEEQARRATEEAGEKHGELREALGQADQVAGVALKAFGGGKKQGARSAAGSLEVVSRRLPRRRTGSAAEPGRRDRYPGKDPEATNRRILMSRRGRWRFSYAFSVRT